ncbi:biosynthetic peptidoglycan transglycosylase [Sulfitobacter alexandrii]|uniref:biosynthetic peptidoglycan transglycosylase n=1 Tax=Sulfitobacter alexandrii TaxID=1917485 RepID=UPI0009F96B30|nr:biosynthetic peptidoglycan transglycosylase [Sulfitobacter alexandrii]
MENKLDLDERFYAGHRFDDGIGLAEFELAAKRLDAEEKAFLWATNTTSLLAPVIWFFGYQLHVDWTANDVQPDVLPLITTAFIIFSTFFSVMSINHVASSRRNRVFAERKIVLLRRSMGVRYGENSLVLPSWRLEGADNPFGLKLFSGYFSYSSFPVFLLLSFSALSIILLFDNIPLGEFSPNEFELIDPSQTAVVAGAVWFLIGTFIFRLSLREQNENLFLWGARVTSFLARIPLVSNVEYNLYRSKLEISEAARIGARTDIIIPFALSIEDQAFYSHRGINWRGVARASWQFARRRRISGGSSITQQCARTNFLAKLSPAWRRKIVEFALARWLESVLSKEEIIRIYLTTARFDPGIYGFHRAHRHFFPEEPEIDRAVSFILVERLGNIRSLFLAERIRQLLERLVSEGLMSVDDVKRVGLLYEQLINAQKIINNTTITPSDIVACFAKA